MSRLGLFDVDNRLRALSALKDPLETLQERILDYRFGLGINYFPEPE